MANENSSKILDKLSSLPKPALYGGFAVIVLILIWAVLGFPGIGGGTKAASAQASNIVADFPDAEDKSEKLSKLEELNNGRNLSLDDYWASLESGGGTSFDDHKGSGDFVNPFKDESGSRSVSEGGLVTSSSSSSKDASSNPSMSSLDPTEYSEFERYMISSGTVTKEQIDEQHAEERRSNEEYERSRRQMHEEINRRTAASSDSAYYDRLERSLAMAQRYNNSPASVPSAASSIAAEPQAPAKEEPAKEEPKRIELPSSVSSASLSGDDIITSLDGTSLTGGVNYGADGSLTVVPAKATFLKTEKLVSGQRVIMRLLQDLRLSDGSLIPANTHISGTCNISDRLKINISSINYGGKIYYTSLEAYDNDGSEGIYCPVIVDDKAKEAGKETGRSIGEAVSQVAGSLVSTVSPYAGMVARTGMNAVVSSVDTNGNTTVTVSSGYEFYVYEETAKKAIDKKN